MKAYEFISYTPTPSEQYYLGILKCRYHGQEQQYKLLKTKDGKTFLGSFDQRRTVDGLAIYEKGINFIDKDEAIQFFKDMMDAINTEARNQEQKPKGKSTVTHGNYTPHVPEQKYNDVPF